MSEIFTIEALARKLDKSTPTMYRMIRAGNGPVVRKLGSRLVVTEEDLAAYLANLPVVEVANNA